MSLRSFHIVFVVTALALLAFLAAWSGQRAFSGEGAAYAVLAAAAGLGLAAGFPYLNWFLSKGRAAEKG